MALLRGARGLSVASGAISCFAIGSPTRRASWPPVCNAGHPWLALRRGARSKCCFGCRNPRENVLLLGCRAAFIVCQTMSIAITVVFPAPVASFSARRSSSGFASALALRM